MHHSIAWAETAAKIHYGWGELMEQPHKTRFIVEEKIEPYNFQSIWH